MVLTYYDILFSCFKFLIDKLFNCEHFAFIGRAALLTLHDSQCSESLNKSRSSWKLHKFKQSCTKGNRGMFINEHNGLPTDTNAFNAPPIHYTSQGCETLHFCLHFLVDLLFPDLLES